MEKQSLTTTLELTASRSAADAEAFVKGRLNGRVRAFRVVCESNGLILSGWCHTYHAKQMAQHLVMESTKLRILANDIEVVTGDEP